MYTGELCPMCNGTGQIDVTEYMKYTRGVVCAACNGIGFLKVTVELDKSVDEG